MTVLDGSVHSIKLLQVGAHTKDKQNFSTLLQMGVRVQKREREGEKDASVK